MKYLILGAGGTGGCIGGYLASSGKDVTFIARGAHLKAIKEKGLIVHSSRKGKINLENVKAFSSDDVFEKFDTIFVCVKGYSLNETISTIKKVSHKKTVVIPILNSLSVGEKLGEALPDVAILDGCVYVSAYISAPGEITQGIKIFRIVFGAREYESVAMDLLCKIQTDLIESGIEAVVSNNTRRDIFRKFSFTSAYAATGAYFDVEAGELQKDGKCRELFIALLRELEKVAYALGMEFDIDLVDESLGILEGFTPDTTASLQKDIRAGKNSEISELIFDVVRIGEKYKVNIPNYKKIAAHFNYTT